MSTKTERRPGFKDLIEALEILEKYVRGEVGTYCEQNVLTVRGVNPLDVSPDDVDRLEKLGFFVTDEFADSYFRSYRWGGY